MVVIFLLDVRMYMVCLRDLHGHLIIPMGCLLATYSKLSISEVYPRHMQRKKV